MYEKDSDTPRRPVAPPVGVCEQCGTEFIPKRQTKGRFCSAECYRAWWPEHGQRQYAAKGLARLEELKAQGTDPRATRETALKRRLAFRNSALELGAGEDPDDDQAWAERGGYWQEAVDPDLSAVLRGRPPRRPLVLSGHGLRFRIEHGTLVIRHGFTHHPQAERTQRFFPGDWRLPTRIVVLDADGSITLDVVSFLARNEVPLVVLDWRGQVVSILGTEHSARDPDLRRRQHLELERDGGLATSIRLIEAKLHASIRTLAWLATPRAARSAERIEELLEEVSRASNLEGLRLLEARAAARYFGCWREVPVRWTGTKRRPIPPEWEHLPIRASLISERNRNATHPISAALNYGYAVLESRVRIAAGEAGLDLSLGALHVRRPGRQALVYDLMEPLRPAIDRQILGLLRERPLSWGDVFLTDRGVCRLHPQLARAVVAGAPLEEGMETIVADYAGALPDSVDTWRRPVR